eukprot:TRINITY_DN531_c0_g1_i9.p1 TRINITY_DN531_c0_g1~~TRINITY_DN531_c0_g1_i9.p1  ORF type:complete len:547 (+),score=140.05 TRINITY_DN531_c0_g1_i9:45-1685(+)
MLSSRTSMTSQSVLTTPSSSKLHLNVNLRALKRRFKRVTELGQPKGNIWKEHILFIMLAPLGLWLAALLSLVLVVVSLGQSVEYLLRYVTMVSSRTTLRTYMGCTFTALPSNADRLDFVLHRGPTYIYGHTIGAVKNFCKWATGGFKEQVLLSDAEVLALLMTTPVSRMWKVACNEEGRPVSMVLDMGDVTKGDVKATDISLGKGHYLCVERIDFDIETSDLSVTLVDSDGLARVVHRPTECIAGSTSNDERLWKLAKAHLQGAVMLANASCQQDLVHFSFLNSVAALTPDVVPKCSALHALLTPHLRFTSTNGLCNKLLPWKAKPASCLKANNALIAFPPEFVTDRLEPDNKLQGLLPYLDFLTEVYKAMEVYAQNLWVVIEHDIFTQWVRHMAEEVKSVKGLSKVDPVKLLATLLWTTVVHGADHDVCGRINTKWMMFGSAVPVDWDGEWQDVLKGSLFGTQLHAFRSSTFISCFGGYKNSWFTKGADLLVSPGLYNDWNSVPCEQTRCRLRAHHGTLLASLHGISKKWGWLSDVAGLPASVSF